MREMVFVASLTAAFYSGLSWALLRLGALPGAGAAASVAEVMGGVALVALLQMVVAWAVGR